MKQIRANTLAPNRFADWAATVYPKKYAHGFCFAVLCCGYTLTDFPISIRLTSLALWQSNDCPSASKAALMNMDKYFMWIHYERLHNHNKAKHNITVCIFLGIYCIQICLGETGQLAGCVERNQACRFGSWAAQCYKAMLRAKPSGHNELSRIDWTWLNIWLQWHHMTIPRRFVQKLHSTHIRYTTHGRDMGFSFVGFKLHLCSICVIFHL